MADIVVSVPCETRLTEAHGGVRPSTHGIVLHATRGPTRPRAGEVLSDTLQREYQAAVNYMLNAANEVSPHFCVGPHKVCRMVHDQIVAWHAQEHNQTHLGIEIAQPAYQPSYVMFQYDATADICARWCIKYEIIPRHVVNDDANGIIGHEETDQGRRDHKSDPGAKWDWGLFIPKVVARIEELKGTDMTAQEKARVQECATHVEATNARLLALCGELERALGATPLAEEIKALHGEYHNWGVAYPRQNAGLP